MSASVPPSPEPESPVPPVGAAAVPAGTPPSSSGGAPDNPKGATPPSPAAAPDDPAGALPPKKKFRLFDLPARMGRNLSQVWEENKILLIAVGFVFAFLLAFFWNDIFVKIRAGEAGVLYRLFRGGTVTDTVYNEGLHIVAPWNTMFIYNARVQQVPDEFVVLSEDGLAIKVEVSIRYRPDLESLGILHKNIGPDYVEKVVKPEIQAQFRFVLGQYKPDQIYGSQGFIVQTVVQVANSEIAERWIVLDDLLLKAVTLPKPVAESIESKLRAQQLAQEFTYRIETELQEAKRKKIEAQGIRDFQDTITGQGISEQFLRFKGIEATLELAKSPNAKTVIIGGGQDRLPLILDGSTRGPELVPAGPTLAPVSGPARK